MASGEFSFDVVSQFDHQELVNAIDQAVREVRTRYDLKDSGSSIELQDTSIRLHSASEMTLDVSDWRQGVGKDFGVGSVIT